MHKIKITLINLLLICFCFHAKCQSNLKQNFDKKDYHILFIGNSLTYTNNLPLLVKKHAKSQGINVKTKTVAYPNYAITDHWNEGEVQKLISSKAFDFVVIQQGPSSQAEGKKMLIDDGKKYSILCKNNNTKLAYFMVWPSLQYYHTFDGVIKNYQLATKLNNAILCPVGEVWRKHFDETENFDYYDSDGFHPSKKGSEVAAKVIVTTLFNK